MIDLALGLAIGNMDDERDVKIKQLEAKLALCVEALNKINNISLQPELQHAHWDTLPTAFMCIAQQCLAKINAADGEVG
jgi:hypothetical protein